MDDENVLCFCAWLTREDLIAAMPRCRDLKELRATTGAGAVCFGCEADLDTLVAEYAHLFGSSLDQ